MLKPYVRKGTPIVSRIKEAKYILSILNREGRRRRILLIGERGCGKKTLIEEVILAIKKEGMPEKLRRLKPVIIDASYQLNKDKEFEMPPLDDDYLIIVEDLSVFLVQPDKENRLHLTNQKIISWLYSGVHAIIAAIPTITYQNEIVPSAYWNDKIIPFYVNEMPPGQIRRILMKWQARFAKQYNVKIPDRIVDEIMELGTTLLKDHAFPLRGIELLDAVSSSAVVRQALEPEHFHNHVEVTSSDLYEQLSHLLRVPVGNYLGIEETRVVGIEKRLGKEIFGQDKALQAISRSVQRALLGTREPGHTHPLGIFLFMGPTGVGKTETARALSRHLFGQDQAVLINMPEFQDPIEGIKRLRGHALAKPISENPFSVIILDEIEKTPQRIREFFLNLFDHGIFKDLQEKDVDASNTFFIMTSNVGSDLFEQTHGILPETFSDLDYQIKKKELLDALRKENFRPEFINRVDEIVLFKPLSRSDIIRIIDSNLLAYTKLIEETEDKQVEYDFGVAEVLSKGCDLNFGARDARRIIRRNVYSQILRTTQYYKAKKILITRSELLRTMDQVSIVVCSKSPKDGISLVLNLNMNKYNLKIHRFESIKEFGDAIKNLHFDIAMLHSSITQDGTKRSTLGVALDHLKTIDHRAGIFFVVDSFQSLNAFKPYIAQGIRSLLRVSELEDWLAGIVAEIKQRKSITQLVEFNYEDLVWKQDFNEENLTLSIILESFGQKKK